MVEAAPAKPASTRVETAGSAPVLIVTPYQDRDLDLEFLVKKNVFPTDC